MPIQDLRCGPDGRRPSRLRVDGSARVGSAALVAPGVSCLETHALAMTRLRCRDRLDTLPLPERCAGRPPFSLGLRRGLRYLLGGAAVRCRDGLALVV